MTRARIQELRQELADPIACACLGPGPDSLPGECYCTTRLRKVHEELEVLEAPGLRGRVARGEVTRVWYSRVGNVGVYWPIRDKKAAPEQLDHRRERDVYNQTQDGGESLD